MNIRLLPAAVLAAILVPSVTAQTTRLVPSQYPTIQAAVNACINGDTVLVAPGTYSGAINYGGKTIAINSSGGPAVTTMSGVAGAAVVTFQGGEGSATVLQGFRITGGGPGIYCHNASPQILNCLVTGNFAPFGANQKAGGMRCLVDAGNGSPTITNCTFSNNAGFWGGALSFETTGPGASSPTIFGCTISNNISQPDVSSSSSNGGGIYLSGAVQLSVLQCVIANNVAAGTYGHGGAINHNGLSLLVQNCRITGNHASVTAGITGSSVSLIGSLVAGNHSSGLNQGATLDLGPGSSLSLCTITGNTTNGFAGGIVSLALTISNSIVWGNDNIDMFTFSGATVSATHCDIGVTNFPVGGTNLSLDPLFVDPLGGDHHLSTGSPCRNAGTPGAIGLPSGDLDGTARVVGGTVDIGADEVPALTYPGTADALDLYCSVNGAGDPLASTRPAVAGDLVTVRMTSSNGTLVGGLPLFAVRSYVTGFPFTPPAGFPWIWLDGQAIAVYGALTAPPFTFPGLPPEGLEFNFLVPPGLAGITVRMQGVVSTPIALNGFHATTNATEVTF